MNEDTAALPPTVDVPSPRQDTSPWGRHSGLLSQWSSGHFPPPRRATLFRVLCEDDADRAPLDAMLDGNVGLVHLEEITVPTAPDNPADAWDAGCSAANAAIDAGSTLIAVALTDRHWLEAIAFAATYLGKGAVDLLGFPHMADEDWMRACRWLQAAIFRLTHSTDGHNEVLADMQAADLLWATAAITTAADREVPILVEPGPALSCALAAVSSQPQAQQWLMVSSTSPTLPIAAQICERLELQPILDWDVEQPAGLSALYALRAISALVALAAPSP